MQEFETEKMSLSMGPSHPSTHCVLRLQLELDGETVTKCDPVLGYLHRHGLRQVPEPLFWCQEENWAAFTLLKGQTIEAITPALLEGVAQFLGRLKAAGESSRDAGALPHASEACFSLQALQVMLAGRLSRL